MEHNQDMKRENSRPGGRGGSEKEGKENFYWLREVVRDGEHFQRMSTKH